MWGIYDFLFMTMKTINTLLVAAICMAGTLLAGEHTLKLAGKEGPGKGKKIVLISGDEEYRSEEAMPMLGKILSQHHGYDCEVLFPYDESGKYIDPNNQAGIRGWEALVDADLVIIGTRFRNPSAEDAQYLTDFMNQGRPFIGIRTATHAFRGGAKFGDAIGYGEWGRKVLGEQWVSHHGRHKVQGARGVIEGGNAGHPILNSVKDVFAPSDVYGVKHLTDADTILMRAAVTETMAPDSSHTADKNDPMQAFAWLHPYTAPNGTKAESFCTTAGASVDLVSEDLRRLIVNAAYHLTGLEVPEKADVSYVDAFYPSFFGFIREKGWFAELDLQAEDFGLGKTPHVKDPPGTPEWNYRDTPAAE